VSAAPADGPAAIVLVGPTASGKSAVAMALAARFPVEIVSVDSAQVYRGMDIGTAKPSAAERARVPHHLVDIVDPTERYSAARFADDASRAIAGIRARGRIPLVVGGTMLYVKALLEGLSELPQADPAVRAGIDARAAALGWPALHRELAALDPETAVRLAPTDRQRIQRALEVCLTTGRPMSALLRPESHDPARRTGGALMRKGSPPGVLAPSLFVALVPSDRAALHRRIAERFDAMLAAGLVAELRALRERYALAPELPSMRAVGYRQAWQHLDGAYDRAELRERGIFATRQLAKRQLTWLRAMPAEVFDALATDVSSRVAERVDEVLGAEHSRMGGGSAR